MEESATYPPPEGGASLEQIPGILPIPSADNPEFIMEALQKNRACQKSMTAVLEAVQERIRANAMLQKKARAVAKASKEVGAKPKEADVGVRTAGLDWPGRKKPKSRRTSCSRIFVALDGTGPEENPDITRTRPVRALLAACVREQRWSEADKERLRGAVRQQVQEKWVTDLMATLQREGREQGTGVSLSALHTGMAQMRQRPVTDADITAALPSLDWENVLTKTRLVGKTAEDCQACWTADCAPGVNRGPWTSEEDEQLKELVAKHEGHDWESVASELGSGRTAVACLMHYQRDLREERPEPSPVGVSGANGAFTPDMDGRPEPAQRRGPGRPPAQWRQKLGPVRKQLWTEEENLRLRYAVAAFGTSSWVHVAEVVGTRTDPQCRERWVNVLDPSVDQSPWTAEEDARLEALVRQLGAGKWAQLADEFNGGRPLKRTDDRLRKHYEALVAHKMIEPVSATPPPVPPPGLQLSVVDSAASRLVRRREAAQAREAKRKSVIVPYEKPEISRPKRGRKPKQKPPQAKETAGIRKTGKSRLAPPRALVPLPPVAPPLEPGLSNVLRLVHAKKVQPTHVGRTGKPAAVVDGKSVHFMQRHVQPVIPVARPVTGSQPPPFVAQANGLLGTSQISGDQQAGARAKGAPRRSVAVRVPKSKLTPEERLAQRRERDRRRRAAERAEREAAEERNGTAAERVAARLRKEQERQEKRQRKEEERNRAREEARRRKQEERDEAQKKRDAEKERLRKEREEARVRKVREKEAEREAKQLRKAEEEAAKRAVGTGKKAAAQSGREQTRAGRGKTRGPISKKVKEKEGVRTATGKGAQKGRGARVGVRVVAAKKGSVRVNGKTQRGSTRGKKDAGKKAAVGRGARKRGERRAEGAMDERRRGTARGASPGGRVSQRLRAVGRPVKEKSGNSGADGANGTEGREKEGGRKRAGGVEGSRGRPAKRGRTEGGVEAEGRTEAVMVTRSSREPGTRTRKRQREEADEEQRGVGAERGPRERRGKKGRVTGGADGEGAAVVQDGEKENGRKGIRKSGAKKAPERATRSTRVEDLTRVTRSRERGTRRGERERGEETKKGRGRPESGPRKRNGSGKTSQSPATRSSKRVSREEGIAGKQAEVESRGEKESKQRRRTSRRLSDVGSADRDEVLCSKESDRSEESETDERARAPARSPEKRTRAKKTAGSDEPRIDMTSLAKKLPAGRELRERKGAAEKAVLRGSKARERGGEPEAGGKQGSERGRSLHTGNKRASEGLPAGEKKRKGVPISEHEENRIAEQLAEEPRAGTRGAEEVHGKQAPPRQLRKAKLDRIVPERPAKRKTSLTDSELRRSVRNSQRKL